jgi:hypothetical protein
MYRGIVWRDLGGIDVSVGVDSPQRLAVDGDVAELHVGLTSEKLRVVGTDGPARIEVTKIGSKGLEVAGGQGAVGTGSGTLDAHAVSGSVSLLARPVEDFSAPSDAGVA